MKIRHILPFALFCLVAASAFGQTKGIAGKWGTDGVAAKTANAVMLDLKIDASNKITGSITEFANALCGSPDTILPIDSGMVDGKVATFVTTRPNPCPAAGAAITPGMPGTAVTWTATLGDDDSMSVTRAIAGGRGGGRGGPGGGGAPGAGGAPGGGAPGGGAPGGGGPFGGGRGGGAPGAGGPPAGGAPPAAAGGAPGGGAPGGGGRGGRGGGGALVMHRLS